MPTSDFWLDFRGVKVGNMQMNGQEVISEFHDQHVYLPERYLQLGTNHISLHILNKYRNDSVGLHSFID